MKLRALAAALMVGTLYAATADAVSTTCNGNKCEVKCADGTSIGWIYWNGSVWSDGVRWDKDKDVVARAMAAAWGTSCQ